MCATSTVIDNYRQDFKFGEVKFYPNGTPPIDFKLTPLQYPVTRQEFEELKASVEELKKLLIEAKAEDIRNNAPDCEMEEKKQFVLKLAELFGIDMSEVFTK